MIRTTLLFFLTLVCIHLSYAQSKTTRGLPVYEAIVFDKTEYDFGNVPEGTIVEKTFTITNKSKGALYINDVETTCGCTVPDYPLDAIPINGSDKIIVKFDTKTKLGMQVKNITVKTNLGTKILKLKGTVYPKDRNY
jgi:Protein of unknown function (DUF1573)